MSKGQHECPVCEADHHAGCVNLACPIGFHNVLWKNPQEITDHTPNPYSDELMRRWYAGRVRGTQLVETRLRERAGEAFAKGNDTEAAALRKVAEMVADMASAEERFLKSLGSLGSAPE